MDSNIGGWQVESIQDQERTEIENSRIKYHW